MSDNARIKVGSSMWMDFRWWRWPDVPQTTPTLIDEQLVFSVTKDRMKPGWSELRADGFGGKPYGNGSIFIEDKYLEPLVEL